MLPNPRIVLQVMDGADESCGSLVIALQDDRRVSVRRANGFVQTAIWETERGSSRIVGVNRNEPPDRRAVVALRKRSVVQQARGLSICWGLSVAKMYCVTFKHGDRFAQWPLPLRSYAK